MIQDHLFISRQKEESDEHRYEESYWQMLWVGLTEGSGEGHKVVTYSDSTCALPTEASMPLCLLGATASPC